MYVQRQPVVSIQFLLLMFFCFILFLSLFWSLSLSPFYLLSPLCAVCLPSVSLATPDGPCERWRRSQRISVYLTLECPSSSSHSLIYHTQVLFIVVWQLALGPWLYFSLPAPLIIAACFSLLGISQHICISSELQYGCFI